MNFFNRKNQKIITIVIVAILALSMVLSMIVSNL